ncbi:MAG: hypothetical protein GY720_17600 [bacterium]|nr:hypothetical protein [bacterium]
MAVAAWDQDVITLGAHAAMEVLSRHPDVVPSTIFFASTTAPYAEGSNVAILAEALNLAGTGCTGFEVGSTTAAGAAAIELALDRVARGPVLVIAADCGRSAGGRPFGDGAVAWLIGSQGECAQIDAVSGDLSWFMDRWRIDGSGDITQSDRSLRAVSPGKSFAKSVGADLHIDDANPAIAGAGYLGTAAYLASVVLAFEGKRKGTRLTASASAGGASHALHLTAGSAAKHVAARFRERFDCGFDEEPTAAPDVASFDPYTSESRRWRERAADLRLEASRDTSGRVVYPPATDGERVGLARSGKVFTQTTDHVYPLGGPVSMAVIELDGGGRFYGQVIDGLGVEIGEPVNLVMRRLHMGGGVPQYFWKIAPKGRT